MDFNLTSDQHLLVNTVRDYVTKTLEPIAMQVESENRIPPEVLHAMDHLLASLSVLRTYGTLCTGSDLGT